MELIKLVDGREFPQHNGEPLSWNIGAHNTFTDEREGYPRTIAVIQAMHRHRPEQLYHERTDLVRGSFDKLFGHNARKLLRLIDATIAKL